jgi:hypothetical protein
MARFERNFAAAALFVLAPFLGIAAHAAVEPASEQGEELAGPALAQPADAPNSTAAEPQNNANQRDGAKADPPSADAPAKPAAHSDAMPSVEGAVEKHPSSAAPKNSHKPAAGEKTKDAPTDKKTPAEAEKALPPAKPKRTLSPEMAALRDQVRQTLAMHHRQPFGNQQNTACEIMDFCLAFGCDTEITLAERSGEKRINGITCLCWNYPCAGYEPLTLIDGRIAARLGYGAQMRPAQMLAMLAFARVQPSYSLRVDGAVRTVADLIESEKRDCRTGGDLSLRLIGLSYYIDEPVWKNSLGEEWSVERIVREVIEQPAPTESAAGMERLLALGYAAAHREKRGLPLDGQFARAKKYVEDFQRYAFPLQNSDGSWGYFLSGRGVNRDADASLRSTAYVLEWLIYTYPEDKLDDPQLVAAVKYLLPALTNRQYRYNASALSTLDINSYAHALHALTVYDDRYFHPADEEKPAAEPKPDKPAAEPATAARSATRSK